ncbi:MAG: DNA primase [Nitrospinaceae bacterium]|nr:MAG: DNA primase [Nitrospinaceae bacterium]
MKNYIPENIIEEIRSRSDIIEIVSDTVLLKKSGQNFKGLCPFHSEKTPSFTVSPEKQIYHCFGCGAGGNAFKFLMETQSLPFLEAVKLLASKANVSLPSPVRSPAEDKKERERQTLIKLNQRAAEYFTATLNHPQRGKKAREYLKSRDISEETATKYQLGWATPNWQDLGTALKKASPSSFRDMARAGLVIIKEGKSEKDFFDRFHARIMIPLKDPHGNTIGFAGRIIDKGEPKYMNSPETPLYKKGKHFFGMNLAKESIRRENLAILVEGHFDQIRAFQHGIHNVVASCGTALTPDQAGLLKNHTQNVVLVFDSDAAGKKAAQRGFEVLLERDMSVKIVHLPEGHDPDSYIHEFGREVFFQQIQNAKPYFESYIDGIIENGALETPSGRMDVVNQALPLLKKVKNELERTEWVKYLWEKAGVDDSALRKELKRVLVQNQPSVNVQTSKAPKKTNPELYLIHLMLSDQRVAREIFDQVSFKEFNDPDLRQVAELVHQFIEEAQPVAIARLLDKTERPEVRAVLTQIGLEPITFENPSQGAADCIKEIKKENVENEIKELKRRRNEAEKAGKSDQSREIHSQLQKIQLSLIPG